MTTFEGVLLLLLPTLLPHLLPNTGDLWLVLLLLEADNAPQTEDLLLLLLLLIFNGTRVKAICCCCCCCAPTHEVALIVYQRLVVWMENVQLWCVSGE